MPTIIKIFTLILIHISILLLLTFRTSAQEINRITNNKVGIGLPLSGDGAWLGQNILNGIKLYLKENNIDQQRFLAVEDLTTDKTSQGITAVKKLMSTDKVTSLILALSPVVNAVANSIESKKIPTIAIVGANTAIGKKYQVKMWPSPESEINVLASKVANKKVALLYSEQDSMIARKSAFESALPKTSAIVYSSVIELEYSGAIINKLMQSKPDIVALFLMPGRNGLIAKKLQDFKFSGEMIGTAGFVDENEFELSRGALLNALYPDLKMTDEFISNYTKEYGKAPGTGSAPGYDAIKLIHQSLEKYNKENPESFNNLLHADVKEGSMGEYKFDSSSNTFKLPVTLYSVNRITDFSLASKRRTR